MPKPAKKNDDELDDEDLEDEDDDAETDDKSLGKSKSKTNGKQQFSQEHVTRVAAKEKRDGRKAGVRQVLEELGFSSLEEAREAIGQLGANDDDDDSDDDDDTDNAAGSKKASARIEREKERLRKDREKLAKQQNELKQSRHELAVENALLQAGVEPKRATRATKLLDVEVGAKAEDIKEAIEELRDDFPELFASEDSDEEDEEEEEEEEDTKDDKTKTKRQTSQRRGNSNPGNRPRKKIRGKTPQEAAKDRLARRHPEFVRKE